MGGFHISVVLVRTHLVPEKPKERKMRKNMKIFGELDT